MNKIIPVDGIADDDKKLEEKAKAELVKTPSRFLRSGFNIRQKELKVTLESKEAVTKDPQSVEPPVRALLVKRHGGQGAVRVTGVTDGIYLETGKEEKEGIVIVTIGTGRICVLFGHPSVRYFVSHI